MLPLRGNQETKHPLKLVDGLKSSILIKPPILMISSHIKCKYILIIIYSFQVDSQTTDELINKLSDLKYTAQMRATLTSLMESSLESAFQLNLQVFIIISSNEKLKEVKLLLKQF